MFPPRRLLNTLVLLSSVSVPLVLTLNCWKPIRAVALLRVVPPWFTVSVPRSWLLLSAPSVQEPVPIFVMFSSPLV